MPPTLKDVARLAGVSTKTVSRVVNAQGEISAQTRVRVQAAIEQLGYRPNILARSLVHQRTDTLAVVAWGIELYGPSHCVLGVEQQSDALGYSLLLNLRCTPSDLNVDSVLDALIARRVDGIIWAIPEVGDNRSWINPDWLQELPPIVFLSMAPRPNLPIVAINNRAGVRRATEHLIEHGRRKIGIITGPLSWWEARERLAGWQEALARAGLDCSAPLIVEGDWSAASGEHGLRTLLEQVPDLDAIFASNDQMALGALSVAHRLGHSVPQDLAIVGFDNISESAHFWPPLTTVHQQLLQVGQIAVQKLHGLIEARRKNEGYQEELLTLLMPELIIRASSTEAVGTEFTK